MNVQQNTIMNWVPMILDWYEKNFVFIENVATKTIMKYAMKPERSGEVTQDEAMCKSSTLFKLSYPTMTQPAPRSDPITACVPEIGMAQSTESDTKMKVEKHTENMMKS